MPLARHDDRIADRHLVGLDVDHALDVAVALGEAARDAGHHAVGIAHRHHAGAEHVAALVDHALHVAVQVAVALQALVDQVGVGRVARRQPRVVDLHARRVGDAEAPSWSRAPAPRGRSGSACRSRCRGTPRRRGWCAPPRPRRRRCAADWPCTCVEQALQPVAGRIEAAGERARVLRHVGDRLARHAGIHRRLRHGRRTPPRSGADRTAPGMTYSGP